MAVPELVLCVTIAQKLDFTIVMPIKLLKYENVCTQKYSSVKKVRVIALLAFSLLSLSIELNLDCPWILVLLFALLTFAYSF